MAFPILSILPYAPRAFSRVHKKAAFPSQASLGNTAAHQGCSNNTVLSLGLSIAAFHQGRNMSATTAKSEIGHFARIPLHIAHAQVSEAV